jgi:hypothetical protein
MIMNETTTTACLFSLDLVALSESHRQFLQYVHDLGVTRRVTTESLRRYRELWLPLVALSYDEQNDGMKQEREQFNHHLLPPPDVAWLWHCHRLAPVIYQKFLQEEFSVPKIQNETNAPSSSSPPSSGSILDLNDPQPQVAFSTAEESNAFTLRWWTRTYPDEPFFLSETADEKAAVSEPHAPVGAVESTLRGFDLLASASRQADLLWQVSSPELGTKSSLKKAVQEYHKFLRLNRLKKTMNRTSSFPLIPTMAIDLVWHTHMTASLALYQKDCITICGSPMDHDDTFTDRSAGGELDVSFQKTAKLWKEVYGEADYLSKGGYRGEPPGDYFFASSSGKTQDATTASLSGINSNSLDSMERGVVQPSVDSQKKDSKQPSTSVGLCSRLCSAKAKGMLFFFLLLLMSTLVRLVTNGALSPEPDAAFLDVIGRIALAVAFIAGLGLAYLSGCLVSYCNDLNRGWNRADGYGRRRGGDGRVIGGGGCGGGGCGGGGCGG